MKKLEPGWTIAAGALCLVSAFTSPAIAQNQQRDTFDSVYAPPAIAGEEQGTNEGGVTIDLRG